MSRPKSFDPTVKLDQALDRFWQSGYGGSSVEELCRAMALKPGSLYGAFGDKRALFLAALDRYVDTISREAVERIGRPEGAAGIAGYFAHLIDAILDGKRRWGCLITNSAVEIAAGDPVVREKIDQHFGRLEAAFAGSLKAAVAAGAALPAAAGAAPFLVCLVQGLNVLAKTRPIRERLEAIVATALSGLGLFPQATARQPSIKPGARTASRKGAMSKTSVPSRPIGSKDTRRS